MNRRAKYALMEAYLDAKEVVIRSGFGSEIDWQNGLDFMQIQETDFLREGAWVIVATGLSERVARLKFPDLGVAFEAWRSARVIVRRRERCRCLALRVFNNSKKVDAIISMAHRVAVDGFDAVRRGISQNGVQYLLSFDFIGPVTCFHFGKNLGLDLVKPDRHLSRIARAAGFDTPAEMCKSISGWSGDKIGVVDLVIWRFATQHANYCQWFSARRKREGEAVRVGC